MNLKPCLTFLWLDHLSSYLISTVMSVKKFPFASRGGSAPSLKNKTNLDQALIIMKLFTFHMFWGVVSSLHYCTIHIGLECSWDIYQNLLCIVSVILTKWEGLLYPEILPDKFKKEAVVGFGNPFLTSKLLLKEQTQTMKHILKATYNS